MSVFIKTELEGSEVVSGFPKPLFFWSLAFCYASLLAMMLQKLILPLFPELHAGNGLLHNDAVVFHNHAALIAEQIKEHGWSEWKLFPQGATGNVGVLSALYAIFGPDPACFIPINAAAHAGGALMIYLIGPLLWRGKVGALGGLVAAILFLVFPSSLQWYGQNHKDAFAITGILMMLYSWLIIHVQDHPGRHISRVLLIALSGALLLAVVRPYFTFVVVLGFVFSWIVLVLVNMVCSRFRLKLSEFVRQSLFIGTVSCVAIISSLSNVSSGVYEGGGLSLNVNIASLPWSWERTEYLPERIDKVLKRASELRVHFVEFNRTVGASSAVDNDRIPSNAIDAITYLPRALVVGLFAPFPSTWTERVSAPRLIGAVEASIWYLLIIGLALFLYLRPSRVLLAGVVFCSFVITVLSYVHPNVGTLYRQRYGVWMFFLLCGAIGWSRLILDFLSRSSLSGVQSGVDHPAHGNEIHGVQGSASSIAASGSIVLMITFVCYLGFMARDLVLTAIFGLNGSLDAFFSAVMIPMFIVTFLSMPLADSMMMPFFRSGGKQIESNVRTVLMFALAILGGATIVLVFFAEYAVGLVLKNATLVEVADAALMLRWFAPIVALSAWTVIGNAVLNAFHKSGEAALAQLVVPVIVIFAILVAPKDYGTYAAIGGMLAGTFVNVLVVVFYARRLGIFLLPYGDFQSAVLETVVKSYRWLMLAALFTAASTPMNYIFAGSAGTGTVSAWAMASKIVLLFNGFASVAVSSVLLPHFARMVAHGGTKELRNHIFFLLVIGSWAGGVLSLAVFEFSEPLVGILFANSAVSEIQVTDLASIIKIGALQLPVVFVASIIIKMAAISGASSRAVIAAVLGLLLNLLLNFLLVPHLGVQGVAMGALAAVVISTAYLAIVTRKLCGFDMREVFVLMLSWLVWCGACVAVSVQSGAAISCAAIGLAGLGWLQWKVSQDGSSILKVEMDEA